MQLDDGEMAASSDKFNCSSSSCSSSCDSSDSDDVDSDLFKCAGEGYLFEPELPPEIVEQLLLAENNHLTASSDEEGVTADESQNRLLSTAW